MPAAALPDNPSRRAVSSGYTVWKRTSRIWHFLIAGVIGDPHVSAFGSSALSRVGVVKATYGTGSSLMRLLSAPVESKAGLSTTVAWLMADQPWYALEGNITVTGGAVDWLAQLSQHLQAAPRAIADYRRVTSHDTDGVYLVPAFAGLGAPHWDENARGLICVA